MGSVAIRRSPLIREFLRLGPPKFIASVARCCHLCLANDDTTADGEQPPPLPRSAGGTARRPAVVNSAPLETPPSEVSNRSDFDNEL
jgi:hypothetical protein